MTVNELITKTGFTALSLPSPKREVRGVYIGDLLSWVMGRAESDNVWITIMSNINVAAVAVLADVGCVILSEGVRPDGDMLHAAKEKGVNILLSDKTTYETSVILSGIGL